MLKLAVYAIAYLAIYWILNYLIMCCSSEENNRESRNFHFNKPISFKMHNKQQTAWYV